MKNKSEKDGGKGSSLKKQHLQSINFRFQPCFEQDDGEASSVEETPPPLRHRDESVRRKLQQRRTRSAARGSQI